LFSGNADTVVSVVGAVAHVYYDGSSRKFLEYDSDSYPIRCANDTADATLVAVVVIPTARRR